MIKSRRVSDNLHLVVFIVILNPLWHLTVWGPHWIWHVLVKKDEQLKEFGPQVGLEKVLPLSILDVLCLAAAVLLWVVNPTSTLVLIGIHFVLCYLHSSLYFQEPVKAP